MGAEGGGPPMLVFTIVRTDRVASSSLPVSRVRVVRGSSPPGRGGGVLPEKYTSGIAYHPDLTTPGKKFVKGEAKGQGWTYQRVTTVKIWARDMCMIFEILLATQKMLKLFCAEYAVI